MEEPPEIALEEEVDEEEQEVRWHVVTPALTTSLRQVSVCSE